jgi:hypothetical protein
MFPGMVRFLWVMPKTWRLWDKVVPFYSKCHDERDPGKYFTEGNIIHLENSFGDMSPISSTMDFSPYLTDLNFSTS